MIGSDTARQERLARMGMAKPPLAVVRRKPVQPRRLFLAPIVEVEPEPAPALASGPAPMRPWKAILAEVCKKHGVHPRDVLRHDRRQFICAARFEAFYRVREERPHLSLPQIAKMFGGYDHTTVLNGIRQHAKRLAEVAQ